MEINYSIHQFCDRNGTPTEPAHKEARATISVLIVVPETQDFPTRAALIAKLERRLDWLKTQEEN